MIVEHLKHFSDDDFLHNFRSSNYDRDRDRDRGTSDIKKRLDDFPAKRDDSYSKRDNYKSRDDYKRDDVPRHTSSNYSGNSNRIDSTSSLSKDRYSDRSNSDYRNNSSRNDDRDTRNGGSNKPRYDPPAADTRFTESRSNVSGAAWNPNSSNQTFGLNAATGNPWEEKQAETLGTGWRGLEANRYDRFANNDRKPVIATSQFVDPLPVRPNQFAVLHSNTIPSGAGRFGGPNRFDNGRY